MNTAVEAVEEVPVDPAAPKFEAYSRMDISSEDYHTDRKFVSSSGLKEMLRSPAHFRQHLDGERVEKNCYKVGTAIHCALLEPDRFKLEYITSPEYNRRTKEGREEEALFLKQAADSGKFVVTEADLEMIYGICENVDKHRDATALLKAGISEKSFYWQDPKTGILCKSRTDNISDFAILDVKSTEDASHAGFVRSCAKYNYDMSAAMYREGVFHVDDNFLDYAFLAVEKKAPYGIGLYIASEEMLASGMVRFERALQRLKECRETDQWPGYQPSGTYTTLEWPSWAYYRD